FDAVQLMEVDALELEPAQAAVARRAEMLRSPVRLPVAGPGALEARLGGDHKPLRVGVELFGDEPLAHLRAVRVGGIDQVDPELDGTAQHDDRFADVGWFAPDPLPGEPHRAEAEAVDGQVAAQEKGAAPSGGTSINAGVAGGVSTEGRCHAGVKPHLARL